MWIVGTPIMKIEYHPPQNHQKKNAANGDKTERYQRKLFYFHNAEYKTKRTAEHKPGVDHLPLFILTGGG